MIATIGGNLSDIVTLILGAMSGVVQLWPVVFMVAFLALGIGTGFIKKIAGGRKGKKRRRA